MHVNMQVYFEWKYDTDEEEDMENMFYLAVWT
jgi:hypothetical protein